MKNWQRILGYGLILGLALGCMLKLSLLYSLQVGMLLTGLVIVFFILFGIVWLNAVEAGDKEVRELCAYIFFGMAALVFTCIVMIGIGPKLLESIGFTLMEDKTEMFFVYVAGAVFFMVGAYLLTQVFVFLSKVAQKKETVWPGICTVASLTAAASLYCLT